MSTPITLIVGDRELSGHHDGLTFSNVDPGGYEMLTCNPQLLQGVGPGAPVIARYGLETAFWGRLNEPGQKQQGGRSTFNLAALGAGDVLKRKTMREIYVDRDLTRWGGPSVARRLALAGSGFVERSSEVVPGAPPALALVITDTWPAGVTPIVHVTYDGQGVTIAEMRGSWQVADNLSFVDANWKLAMGLATDNAFAGAVESADLQPSGDSGSTSHASAGKSFAYTYMHYVAGPAGTAGQKYTVQWTNLRLLGAHGLTVRGATPATEGFYPDDIAWDAVQRVGGIGRGVIEQASSYVVPHCVYLDETPHDTVVGDQATIMGWHWGVWEPAGIFSDVPLFHFRSPPADATVVISLRDCQNMDVPKVRLDKLFDTAKVAYTDAAGTRGVVTVTQANPLLIDAGLTGQTLTLNLGVGSAGAATLLGQAALRLAASSARGGGSAIVPGVVLRADGGTIPSCLLKSGRDRIRLLDLPDAGPIGGDDSRRFDTFRIKRVETTVTHGVPQTRIEFDGGADLLEVLNARSAQARVLTGT